MQHPTHSDHARHDATLIAGHAAGDLTDTERARADALLAECGPCSELRRDLVAIAAATRSVPAPAARTRDLRLAPEQAERLRRGSWLRTILRPFSAAGSPIRPMATAFTSLGAVGLVVGITLSSGPQMAGSQAVGGMERDANQAAAATAAPAAPGNEAHVDSATLAPVALSSGDGMYAQGGSMRPVRASLEISRSAAPGSLKPASTEEVVVGVANQGGKPRNGAPSGDTDNQAARLVSQPPNPLIAGSLGLLGIGLLLFGLRLASTRVR